MLVLNNVFQAMLHFVSIDNFPQQSVKEAARKKMQEIDKRQIEIQREQEQDTLETVDTIDNKQ
jgi:hypothetical protein